MTAVVLCTAACNGKKPTVLGDAARDLEAPVLAGPPVTFRGIAKDREGTPLPDVLVIAWPKGKRSEALAQGRTDEDGRFLLPGLRPGRWSLLVEAGGIGTLETERQVPEDGDAELVLDGRSLSITGVVSDAAGRPQGGARVTLGSSGLRWTRSAVADANGNFVISGLGQGKLTLRAALDKRVSTAAVVVLDETASLRPRHVRLTLQAGVFVDGTVSDDTGRPLAGAAVDVMAVPADDLPVSGLAAADGRFQLGPIAAGRYQILARLEGYVLMEVPEVSLGGRARESFRLRMARTARVEGRVLAASGRPLAGAQVSAIALIGGRDDLVVIPGALPLAAEAAVLPIGKLVRPGGVRSAPTDADGRFAVTDLAPGRARLVIQHPEHLQLAREPLLLVPGDVRSLGELTMIAGATVAGRVLDQRDAPVEGATVEARVTGKARPAMRAVSDEKGQFFFRVPYGDYVLSARTDGLASTTPLAMHVAGDVPSDACTVRVSPRSADASAPAVR